MTIAIATEAAIERSSYVVRCTFTDEDGDPAVPTAINWSLEDLAGNTINSRSAVAVDVPAAVVDIVLHGEDLALSDQHKEFEVRRMIVAATYDSILEAGLPLAGSIEFKVLNTNTLTDWKV